jgi:GT2 family glycosyltransferase
MTGGEIRHAREATTAVGHTLRRTAWLSEEVMLLACAPGAELDEGGQPPSSPMTVAARAFVGPLGTLFAAAPSAGLLERPGPLAFVDEDRLETLTIEAGAVTGALTNLRTLLREGPAAWDADARTSLLCFLATLGVEHGLSHSLSDGLRQVREALRERQPLTIKDRRAERGVAVERLHRIDDNTFYIVGRAWDMTGPITTLVATSPEGDRIELIDRVFPRPDLDGAFIGMFHTIAPTRCSDGWVVEAGSGPRRAVESLAALAPDPLNAILADAALDLAGAEALLEHHIHPAISRLHELRRNAVAVADVETYGAVSSNPIVSLVVTLQRRVDLIEHQLAQFATDPALEECELIYVLDDPEQRDLLRELAEELFRLYGVPLRVVTLTETGGFSTACNLGASVASGDRLVLLQADVLPDCPGWLGAMSAALDAETHAGAIAPKLLYEDQAIDQAGLDYNRPKGNGEWRIEHRFRGLHRSLPAANLGGPVPAIGAACLMIDAALFREVDGLSAEYMWADYEGSDLSRRLADAGYCSWYLPEVELYRLEGLGAAPEAVGERYVRWLHARLWGSAIESAKER